MNNKGYSAVELTLALSSSCLFVLTFGGWIANIVKLVGIISEPVTGMFILRCVGIVVAPLGVILGFC